MENREISRRNLFKLAGASILAIAGTQIVGCVSEKETQEQRFKSYWAEQERRWAPFNAESDAIWNPLKEKEKDKLVTESIKEAFSEAEEITLTPKRVEFWFNARSCPLNDSAIWTVARRQDKVTYGYQPNTILYYDRLYNPIVPDYAFPGIDRKAFERNFRYSYRVWTRYYMIFLDEYPRQNSNFMYKFDESVPENVSLVTSVSQGSNTVYYPHVVNPDTYREATVGDKDAGKTAITIVAVTEDKSGFNALESGKVSVYWQGDTKVDTTKKILHIPAHLAKGPSADNKWKYCQRSLW